MNIFEEYNTNNISKYKINPRKVKPFGALSGRQRAIFILYVAGFPRYQLHLLFHAPRNSIERAVNKGKKMYPNIRCFYSPRDY